jgi:hypothetical protein
MKTERNEMFLTVHVKGCQVQCCILRNNYLDNAPVKQVIENHLHAFKRAMVRNKILEQTL